ECEKNLKTSQDKTAMEKTRKSAYGRISSVVHKVEKDLELLQDARDFIRHLPTIEVEEPVVVIAGAPNVGKSLIMTKITTARPVIASYPFTTQSISLGHMEIEKQHFQLMDTPGLLDRPLEERNDIERQAILAIEHIAHLIVFIFDPSESCGYTMEKQENLLKTIKASFPDIRLITISNKSDMATMDGVLSVSALEDKGMEELKAFIFDNINVIYRDKEPELREH
ncbi:MAG: 50S ribosome-binding GTPase, partial [Thermoplasmata archaeon]|nr:50S ribosome-binding GTPase [Thermoplasmata archaeon]